MRLAPKVFLLFCFKYFGILRICGSLFQKRVVRTPFEMFLLIACIGQIYAFRCFPLRLGSFSLRSYLHKHRKSCYSLNSGNVINRRKPKICCNCHNIGILKNVSEVKKSLKIPKRSLEAVNRQTIPLTHEKGKQDKQQSTKYCT